MIAKCRKPNTDKRTGKLGRIEYPLPEVKGNEETKKDVQNREKAVRDAKPATDAVAGIRKTAASWPVVNKSINIVGTKRRLGESCASQAGIKLGELSVGKVKTEDEARSFRKRYKLSSLNLALFPSSCAPPTLAHENIMSKVLTLPFVEQVWVDVNYKSYTKEGIEHMFNERLEMVKLVISDKPGFDFCTLSKDTHVGEEKACEVDTYFAVARALVGAGVLSWVVGGDVIMNMIYWKERAKANLLQVDRLIICTRGKTRNEIQEILVKVFASRKELDEFLPRVHYIHTTADISSTAARERLSKILSVVSPKILRYIISQTNVLEQYYKEARPALR